MNIEDYRKAGRISAEAREYAKKIVVVGASLLKTTEQIEQKIIDLGGKPAWPVDMSINNIAAHYSATANDKTIFKDDEIIKVDIGVHVNGAIADTAISIDLGGDHKKLIMASEKAVDEALKIIRPGVKLFEIGQVIQETIQDFGYSPIRNLCGHGLELYKVHSEPSIPNVNNNSQYILKEGQVIAIEPFATDGAGLVTEGKPSEIYELEMKKPIRNPSARKILAYVEKEFNTLPFNKRWLMKKFNNMELTIGLLQLEKEGILHQYSILPEKNNGLVSQAEHTVIVLDKPIITTRI
jgi:methionyl aminopeptidase